MPESSAYGDAFGEILHARTTSFVTHSLRNGLLAATEVRGDNPQHGLSSPIVREDAFLIALQLRDYPDHEYWEDGQPAARNVLKAGHTTMYDLKRDPRFIINAPFRSVHYYFPRAALDGIADAAQAPRIDELRCRSGAGIDDPVMRGLTESLLPAFERPEQANRLFVEQVTLAVGVHAAGAYLGMRAKQLAVNGGLAPWQEKRAKDMIEAHLDGEISPATLAEQCGLSASHFARAFRKSTGMAPHQWLLQRRVAKAKQAMRESDDSLAEIAMACGFADQSHFTRVFGRVAGISPGWWRRQVRH
jgi:AraC family transcriptional regulator